LLIFHYNFAVIGYPVVHSLSPQIFEAAFKAAKIDARFLKFEVAPDRLENFLQQIRAGNLASGRRLHKFGGLAVTIPHKEKIMPLLDEVDDIACAIGAINTVANENGRLKGYNTDWQGALQALEETTEVAGKKIVILGAGGAAAAIAHACAGTRAFSRTDHGSNFSKTEIIILSRSREKAKTLAEKIKKIHCHSSPGSPLILFGSLAEIFSYLADIVINATPVGMASKSQNTATSAVTNTTTANATAESPIPKAYFRKNMVVMDCVYTPQNTRFLQDAAQAGCKIIPGSKMFLYQAACQFEIWFNQKPDLSKMAKAVQETLCAVNNAANMLQN